MKIFIPISVSALNRTIDADLIFTAAHGIIRQAVTDNILSLRGGTSLNTGAGISLYGWETGDGNTVFYVPGPASPPVTAVIAAYIRGHDHADAGCFDMNAHRIVNIAEATTANDALRFNAWADWTPTVTWGGGTPTGSVAQVARYTRTGKTVFFDYRFTAADSNACSSCTISLPVAVKNNASLTIFSAIENNNGVFHDPLAYNANSLDSNIAFYDFTTGTDGAAIWLLVSGRYEIA